MEELSLQRHPALVIIDNTPKGRGVFAKESIPTGTTIEVCPVLIFPISDLDHLKATIADHYTYNWPIKDPTTGKTITTQAISLGLGSIFNHSTRQNVGFQCDLKREVIVYQTLRHIAKDEELCISYGPNLWFDDVDGDGRTSESELDQQPSSILSDIQLGLD